MVNDNLYVALIHHPVTNRNAQTIGSALTTIDLHDIARASVTFGVKGFYVVTPYEDQAVLARQVIEHWTRGVGGTINPYRKDALELIRVTRSFEETCESIQKERSRSLVTVATSAKQTVPVITTGVLKQKLNDAAAHLLLFGTAWGLTDELIASCDFVLEPIYGAGEYNHLSVRSAVSIYLDRILNSRL